MTDQNDSQQSLLLTACGALGLIGCLTVLGTDVAGSIIIDGYNPISETISDLAAGRRSWIQDAGLVVFAVGLFACGFGLFRWNLGGLRWNVSASILMLLALNVFVIAVYNEYGDNQPGGVTIHIYLVYFLGIAFALITGLAALDLDLIDLTWRRFSMGLTVAWVILAPFFFLVPDGWDGAYERFVALLMIAWVVGLSWLLIQRGRGRLAAEQ